MVCVCVCVCVFVCLRVYECVIVGARAYCKPYRIDSCQRRAFERMNGKMRMSINKYEVVSMSALGAARARATRELASTLVAVVVR